jgi:hypothetical protein
MKQETLEETAEKYAKKWNDLENQFKLSSCFIAGYRLAQERSYSELSIYLQELANKDRLKSLTSNQIRAMIEQFKNK